MSGCLLVKADPDGSVKVLHHTIVLQHRVSVVGRQVCGRYLHLTLFEYDLDHDVCQKQDLLLMQTRSKQDKNHQRIILPSRIWITKKECYNFTFCIYHIFFFSGSFKHLYVFTTIDFS